ncbi:unnamed protein product [Ceutorhynchus assimilis]|uniref:Uncharacterized protein n=1 Tax=Ceutorhynchus assimilis TaxID=467358 RepID=A0A9N9MAM8_9CUCU|nr:unnamed protein product [Ceutorhynchus assimilis]
MLKFVSVRKNTKRRYKSLVQNCQLNYTEHEKITMLQNQMLNIKPKQGKGSEAEIDNMAEAFSSKLEITDISNEKPLKMLKIIGYSQIMIWI